MIHMGDDFSRNETMSMPKEDGVFTPIVKHLMLEGTKMCGAEVNEVLSFIEEQLTPRQYTSVKAFLTWSFKTKNHFGYGNIDKRIKEFKERTRR